MSEFSELVKRFDRIRTYVRDFYVYGFKTREDYDSSSGRTYDNERRRIESWFGPYIHSKYHENRRKSVAITIDSSSIALNPLFSSWKSKSFTSNDIMLHFLIVDLLTDGSFYTADQTVDEIQLRYDTLFDAQTVRKKLMEYERLGILTSRKEGRRLLYGKKEEDFADKLARTPEFADMVSFYQGSSPFGFVGSTILDNLQKDNTSFRLKHDFLVHTLEDEVLQVLLLAIEEQQMVNLVNKSAKTGRINQILGLPLKILVSTQTGRRYAILYRNDTRRFSSFRLDYILSVSRAESQSEGTFEGDTAAENHQDYEKHKTALEKNLPKSWGVSFGESHGLETVSFTVLLNEESESHIINRLEREGRGGTVTRLKAGIYRYTRECFDCNELLPWVKTFVGRILDFSCTNPMIARKFHRDMERMAAMYGEATEEGRDNGT